MRAHHRERGRVPVRSYRRRNWNLPRPHFYHESTLAGVGGSRMFRRDHLVPMTPRAFLHAAGFLDEDIAALAEQLHLTDQAQLRAARRRLMRGEKMDPLVLEYHPDYRRGDYAVRTDGNHRALVALELGIRHVPVDVRWERPEWERSLGAPLPRRAGGPRP